MSDEQIHRQLKNQALKGDNSFELLPDQQLWQMQFTIVDKSCWEVIAVSSDRKIITAKWIDGTTKVGVINLSGKRVEVIAVKDVVELIDDF